MTGHQAIIAGAKRAGCTFAAGRPAVVVEPLLAEAARKREASPQCAAALEQYSIDSSPLTVQRTDDDIAAVGSCIAAAAAGATAMAATSGAALSACGENLTLAQMAELPLVIVHFQHLGSADGRVLLTSDIDVTLARYAGISGAPLPVFAATDVASSYQLAYAAFGIARRLRTPVLLLTSLDIMASERAINAEAIELSRGNEPKEACCTGEACGTGVSPVLGHNAGVCWNSERDPLAAEAPPSLDAAPRSGFVQFAGTVNGQRVFLGIAPDEIEARLSRLRDKILGAAVALEFVQPDIDPDAETLLLSYGLADQAARQAVALVRKAGARVSHLTIHSLWPVAQQALRRALTPFIRRVLIPELNLGLYAYELQQALRNVKIESLTRYDGRLIEPAAIARRITGWPCG
jgi:2-oxoglutarate/2-oxoacid ferredoxin oxidoreductase subunit alpha